MVGVQPFGGHGLSGTGPKAGGPLYLRRLLASRPADCGLPKGQVPRAAMLWHDWLSQKGAGEAADPAGAPGGVVELAGPVGELNLYSIGPRGTVLCVAREEGALRRQVGAALAAGNKALVIGEALPWTLPSSLAGWVEPARHFPLAHFDAVLHDDDAESLRTINRIVASRDGPLVAVHSTKRGISFDGLVQERSVSTNTTAAGGNANLMMIG